MKTNNVMVRPMGQFSVTQRTKDGMFNATALLKQWNTEVSVDTQNSGYVKKDMDDFFANKNVKEFLEALMTEENLHTQNSAYVKSKARADRGGGTWMHPILFIKFAMWLNPRFEVQVIKFVYDQMIKYRNDAGDAYKELGAAMSSIVTKQFMATAMSNVSRGINYIVFGDHYTAIRNDKGTEELQRELFELERKVSELVNDGFLTDYDGVIAYLRKKWKEKYTPKVLS